MTSPSCNPPAAAIAPTESDASDASAPSRTHGTGSATPPPDLCAARVNATMAATEDAAIAALRCFLEQEALRVTIRDLGTYYTWSRRPTCSSKGGGGLLQPSSTAIGAGPPWAMNFSALAGLASCSVLVSIALLAPDEGQKTSARPSTGWI